ncbi:disease resistance protein TAO1-like [Raphanus sativus]|uniref:Disease resistance protein TAO1-like n=1 Tax=Raphanus sativus TaxID=3726 RepID=A0A6J0KM48_RAPSA|nr:disease resistance protein TAO1-like [Raphanus sativus]
MLGRSTTDFVAPTKYRVDQQFRVGIYKETLCLLIFLLLESSEILFLSSQKKIVDYSDALEMFCMYAFGQKDPKDGFSDLPHKVVSLVGELPLGLKVMGSYFRGMSEQDCREALQRLEAHLDRDGEIASILKFSYDSLCDEDKRLFLHIAIFFNGENFDIVEGCLANCFSDVRHGLHVLTEKSLISKFLGEIEVAKLLVELGRKIVREQSVNEPGKRQFLTDASDIAEVLSDDRADSSSVIGFTVGTFQEITWTSERAFERLSNLQFLRILGKGVNPRSMNHISQKLRVLIWHKFQMPCFPSSFNPKFLVKLKMPYSKLEKLWEETKPLNNLKWMDLSYSDCLEELPDLSTATNLYDLDLSHCSSLVKLPYSIGNAINLEKLNLSGCSSLSELPSTIGNIINLQEMNLSYCSSLLELPSSIGNATNLQKLNLSHCSNMVELPSSADIEEFDPCMGRLSRLRQLVLNGMEKLVSLPQLPDSLCKLDAENCESLERLDCSFRNPDIRLNFRNCFKLNQEARDLIIRTPTNEYEEVPQCFTYRSSGSSLTVNLNQMPLGKSTKFKACIILPGDVDENDMRCWRRSYLVCRITSGGNDLNTCFRKAERVFPGHLYTFEVEAETEEMTSTELVFEFEIRFEYSLVERSEEWEIKECGMLQIYEVPSLHADKHY